MATRYKFVRNDTSPQLKVTLAREDGSAVDITGAQVFLYIRQIGETTITLSKAMTVTDGANGVAIAAWSSTDLTMDAGLYEGEIEVITSTYRETVYDLIRIDIRDDIA